MSLEQVQFRENSLFPYRRRDMISLDDITKIQRLKDDGFSIRHVAKETHLHRLTVKKYWNWNRADPLRPSKRVRNSILQPYSDLLKRLYKRHENCVVVRELFIKQTGISVSTRRLQQFLSSYKKELRIEENQRIRASRRIETKPREWMQIDFGERWVWIAGKECKVAFFVGVLAYSRRMAVWVSDDQSQDSWLQGIEHCFSMWGGKPLRLLADNARPLVAKAASILDRYCTFTDRFLSFCRYHSIQPCASRAAYPESKGKVERMVGYVKHNGIAGRHFDCLEDLQRHLDNWCTETADHRTMQGLPEDQDPVPASRFEVERKFLRPAEQPSFLLNREIIRKVNDKGLLRIDRHDYQLAAEYRSKQVRVLVDQDKITVRADGQVIATFNKTLDVFKPTIETGFRPDGQTSFGAAIRADAQILINGWNDVVLEESES